MLFFPTVDEDVQYFRSQGYTGSINDMHFKAMGDLGYTGSLNDRIHAYLTFKYGSYYAAMRDLRNGTSVFALSSYIINGFDPALVFDFKGNYFRKGSSASTFGASITHAASTNATMVDSDGLLKWRPHNRVTSSGDLTGTGWSTVRATYDGPTETLTQQAVSTTYGIVAQAAASLTVGARYKYTIRMKAGNTGWGVVAHVMTASLWVKTWFDLSNGVVGTVGANTTATIVDAGDGWWDCSVEAVASSGGGNISAQMAPNNGGASSVSGDTLLVRQVHAFRSDLGGMVNNPDTSNSYVPTTTAAVYAPRRGHHIHNGSAWVNEGILHESEARTNLMTYSNDLSSVAWGHSNSTIAINAGASPDGTNNANKSTPDTTNNIHYNYATINSPSSVHSYSVYVASAGYGFATIGVSSNSSSDYYTVVVNLSNGTKTATYSSGTQTDKTCTVEAVGSYYRVSISGSGEKYLIVGASDTGTYTPNHHGFNSFSGDGTSGILIYGAQVEAGSTPSSYIPTTTTVTRAAETLTVPAANLLYSSTNMSIQIDGKMTYADRNLIREVQFVEWLADSNNGIEQFACSGTGFFPNGAVAFFQEAAAATSLRVTPAATLPFGVNVPFNISSRHGSTFLNGAVGGTALTADTTPTALPNLSSTNLNLGQAFMGTIGQYRMWSDDLGDVGITKATLPSTEPSLSLTFDGSETSFTVLDWSE